MKKIILVVAVLASIIGTAQTSKETKEISIQENAAERILSGNIKTGVTVGGYGEITYNQPKDKNGELDIQRLVLLFGYKFNDKVQFITEIEFEHVKEVFVEQAFLQYKLNDNLNAKGGLMLVPMGLINEYHEPTTFNGVERPSIDKSIVPTTWREIGVGISGKSDEASLKYQAYIFNGFASVNGTKLLGGKNALRNGRQKGAASTVSKPNFSAKVDYYGIQGLRLGLAGYFGRTQATEADKDLEGSDVGVAMLGLDARYNKGRFSARGEFIRAGLKDADAYNNLYGSDLGSAIQGWNLEVAYNLFSQDKYEELIAFARYDDYDTHASVNGGLAKNSAYDRNEMTFGLSYKVAPGAVVKGDYQIKNNAVSGSSATNQLNFGIGVWF